MAVFVAIYPYALKEKAVCASINTLLLAIFLDHLRQLRIPLDLEQHILVAFSSHLDRNLFISCTTLAFHVELGLSIHRTRSVRSAS